MAALILPERLRRSPQQIPKINRGNPLTQGLVHSWGVNALDGFTAYDAAGSAHGKFGVGIPASGPSGNSWRYDGDTPYINYDDNGTGTTFSPALTVGDANGSGSPGSSNTFSIAVQFYINTYTGAGANVGGPQALYAGNTNGIEFRVNTDGYLQLLKQGTASLGIGTGAKVPLNSVVTAILSYNNGVMQFILNGALVGSATVSQQSFLLATQYFLGYGTVPGGNIERFANGGRLYRLDVWNRAIALAEAAAWHQDNLQVYAGNNRMILPAAVAVAANVQVAPNAGAIGVAGYAPAIGQTANQSLILPAAGIALAGFAPAVARTANAGVTPGTAGLGIAGYAPAVAQTANAGISPAPGSIALAGYAPAVVRTANLALPLGAGTIGVAGFAPTVQQSANAALIPATANLAVMGYAPAVSQSANMLAAPATGSVALSGRTPTVSQTANVNVAPAAAAIGLAGFAPAVKQAVPGVGIYPPPSLVVAGFKYGPNGDDFTGTYVGGGLTTEQDDMLMSLAKIHGLVRGAPLVVGPTSRVAGDLEQTITENNGSVTLARK